MIDYVGLIPRYAAPKRRTALNLDLVIHHTVSTASPDKHAEIARERLGADTVSYHYLIYQTGLVYKCRAEWEIAACVHNGNSRSLCIAICDNLSENVLSSYAFDELVTLTLAIAKSGILARILRHSQVKNTECPGPLFPWHEFLQKLLAKPDFPRGIALLT